MLPDFDVLQFNDQGLIPAIVQEASTGQVLMLAYMNRQALEQTVATGLAHYWSRSRATLWQKGETSGHIQRVRDICYDCDADTLLVSVDQEGAACHTGEHSCFVHHFFETPPAVPLPISEDLLQQLYDVIQERKQRAPQESYVASLMAKGADHILKKVIEEAAEVVMAAKDGQPRAIVYEMADLWFHAMVALAWHNIPPQQVFEELRQRFGTSGLRPQHVLHSPQSPGQSA